MSRYSSRKRCARCNEVKVTNPNIISKFNKVDVSVGTAGSISGTIILTLTTEIVDVNKKIAALS